MCSSSSAEREEAGVVEAAAAEALDELRRSGRVDREGHQGLATLVRARDGHVGDVDTGLAECRADAPDHAGHVVVAEKRHPGRELDLDLIAERAHKPEPALA